MELIALSVAGSIVLLAAEGRSLVAALFAAYSVVPSATRVKPSAD